MKGHNKGSQGAYQYALSQGFVLVRKTKHIIMRRGKLQISLSTSTSDRRSVANSIKLIDRLIRAEEAENAAQTNAGRQD